MTPAKLQDLAPTGEKLLDAIGYCMLADDRESALVLIASALEAARREGRDKAFREAAAAARAAGSGWRGTMPAVEMTCNSVADSLLSRSRPTPKAPCRMVAGEPGAPAWCVEHKGYCQIPKAPEGAPARIFGECNAFCSWFVTGIHVEGCMAVAAPEGGETGEGE